MSILSEHTSYKAGLPKSADQTEKLPDNQPSTPDNREDHAVRQGNEEDTAVDNSNYVMHIRDVNSHEIFRNNTLISQLLKDYSGVSLFSDIKPEDIEDQTERFRLILGIEVEADTIKKVHIRIEEQEQDVFVIALIEHKSYIDYDIMMQLLTYMVMIWKDYARE